MVRQLRRALAAFIVLSFPAVASAQQLRGAVRDSGNANPLAGAVVTVIDSAGVTTARAITDAAGAFSVTLTPRAARLRFLRIGYRPREVPVPPPARRDVPLQLAMDRIPAILNTVRVSDRELCPGSEDRGAAFQLWEQARAGLTATIVARELKPALATTLTYESGMSPGDERIRRQTKSLKKGQTTRPFFSSATPSFFARVGYMIEDNTSGRVFSAPDADVLVDESFAATHCFRLQNADAAHAGQLGVAFTPVPGRDTLVDVKGVIWIDARTPQLRSLDFQYTSLEPAAMQIRTGGHIEFRTMENGVAFIERWHLRLPNLQVTSSVATAMTRRVSGPGPVRRSDRFDLRVAEIVEAGGIVLEATWRDGTRWHDTPATVKGTVTHKQSGSPVMSGIVTLLGTQDSARTATNGEFEIAAIPGKYMIVATDTSLVSFVAARSDSRVVELPRATVVPVHLEVAPIESVVADICRGQRLRPNTAMIVGVIALGEGALPRDARVKASWQADYVKDAISGIQIQQSDQQVTLDADGRFVVCGVARDRPVKLSLVRGNTPLGDTTVTVTTNTFSHAVAWMIRARPPEALTPPS